MTDIHWENIKDNLCVMCSKTLKSFSYYLCKKCSKICEIVAQKVSEEIMDIKSVCCKADVDTFNKITCSDSCHEKFIQKMIRENGIYKKVVDLQSNITYRIPTRLIIEQGILQEELKKHPRWNWFSSLANWFRFFRYF